MAWKQCNFYYLITQQYFTFLAKTIDLKSIRNWFEIDSKSIRKHRHHRNCRLESNHWHQPKRKHRHHRYHNLNQTIDTSQNNRFKTDSKSIRNTIRNLFEIRFENIHTRNFQLESNHRYHRTINSRCDTEVENLQNQNEVFLENFLMHDLIKTPLVSRRKTWRSFPDLARCLNLTRRLTPKS